MIQNLHQTFRPGHSSCSRKWREFRVSGEAAAVKVETLLRERNAVRVLCEADAGMRIATSF
jgi:hypothetical protein